MAQASQRRGTLLGMVLVAPQSTDQQGRDEVLALLREGSGRRPHFDPGLAGGLRAWLEDSASLVVRARGEEAPALHLGPRQLVDQVSATTGAGGEGRELPRVVVVAGLSMLFAPLNVAAFAHIPKELRGAAVGLLALLRNEGGSVGTSVAQTIQERRAQFHTLRLNEHLDSLNPAVNEAFKQGHSFFLQNTGDGPLAQQMTLQALENLRNRQASSLAYFDVFWCSAVVAALLIFLVLLMRRSVAEKGAHIGAE